MQKVLKMKSDNQMILFSIIDCYEYSTFCKNDMKIFKYPTFNVYNGTSLIKVIYNFKSEIFSEVMKR